MALMSRIIVGLVCEVCAPVAWFGVPDRICCLGSCAQEQANNSIRNVTEWESGGGVAIP
jgi:hypothetical protein